MKVLKILGLPDENNTSIISVAMNVTGKKEIRKDVVKIEDRELVAKEVDGIALIAPDATINIIRDHKVAHKQKVKLPGEIREILRCSNPNCITNKTPPEPLRAEFRVVSREPLQLKCNYCKRLQKNIENNII